MKVAAAGWQDIAQDEELWQIMFKENVKIFGESVDWTISFGLPGRGPPHEGALLCLCGKQHLFKDTVRNCEFYTIALASPHVVMLELARVAAVSGYQGASHTMIGCPGHRMTFGKNLTKFILH